MRRGCGCMCQRHMWQNRFFAKNCNSASVQLTLHVFYAHSCTCMYICIYIFICTYIIFPTYGATRATNSTHAQHEISMQKTFAATNKLNAADDMLVVAYSLLELSNPYAIASSSLAVTVINFCKSQVFAIPIARKVQWLLCCTCVATAVLRYATYIHIYICTRKSDRENIKSTYMYMYVYVWWT